MIKFEVTLSSLRKAYACYDGYNKVVRALQGAKFEDEDYCRDSYIRFVYEKPISILSILKSNGLADALWALRCVPGIDRDARLFIVWCGRQVQHLMTDKQAIEAFNIAERIAIGTATEDELAAARTAARTAAWTTLTISGHPVAVCAMCAVDERPSYNVAAAAIRTAAATAIHTAAATAAQPQGRPDPVDYTRVAQERKAARAAMMAAIQDMLVRMCNGTAPWQVQGARS